MRKSYAVFLAAVMLCVSCSYALGDVPIDAAHFPDAAFCEFAASFDVDADGVLSDVEIASADSIYADGLGISSLAGIEYFTELAYLYCRFNNLTEIDISKNVNLLEFNCRSNRISRLDVSRNISLEYLGCSANELTELDLSSNTSLKWLFCYGNHITDIVFPESDTLVQIECYSNDLSALDVSGRKRLQTLRCQNNRLVSLNLEGCTTLTELNCTNNQIENLDLSSCTSLIYIYADSYVEDGVPIDEAHFPDKTFRNTISGYDTNGSGILNEREAAKVTSLQFY